MSSQVQCSQRAGICCRAPRLQFFPAPSQANVPLSLLQTRRVVPRFLCSPLSNPPCPIHQSLTLSVTPVFQSTSGHLIRIPCDGPLHVLVFDKCIPYLVSPPNGSTFSFRPLTFATLSQMPSEDVFCSIFIDIYLSPLPIPLLHHRCLTFSLPHL